MKSTVNVENWYYGKQAQNITDCVQFSNLVFYKCLTWLTFRVPFEAPFQISPTIATQENFTVLCLTILLSTESFALQQPK